MGSCPLSHTALGRSCDKLKPYLYHSLYGHQTGEDSDLLWGASKSHDALIIWSCKITGQSKTIIFRLPHSFWPPNLGGLWLTLSGSHPENYTTLWSHGLERLRDKLKLLNRHYQCLWPGSLTGSWSSLKDYYPYGHMTLKSRGFARSRDKLKTNVTIIPTAAKIGTVVTYSKELQLIKFYDSSITSFCETTWQLECFISPPALEQWLPNMTRWWLTMRV